MKLMQTLTAIALALTAVAGPLDELMPVPVSVEARANIHLRQIYGDEAHHVCEGLFKSFARALRQAKAVDPNEKGVPSSKGVI